jgi:hypothetical protein
MSYLFTEGRPPGPLSQADFGVSKRLRTADSENGRRPILESGVAASHVWMKNGL